MSDTTDIEILHANKDQVTEAELLTKTLEYEEATAKEASDAAKRIHAKAPGLLGRMMSNAFKSETAWRNAGIALGAAAGGAAAAYGGQKLGRSMHDKFA